MKYVVCFLLSSAFFCVPSSAQECSKASDACAATTAPRSPFLEASSKPESAPAVKKAAAKKAAVKKPAVTAVTAAPAASTAAPAAASAPAEASEPEPLSSPLWIFFVAGGLAVLYLYLANGKKRKRK